MFKLFQINQKPISQQLFKHVLPCSLTVVPPSLYTKFQLTHQQTTYFSSTKYLQGFRNTHMVEISEGCLPKITNPKNPPFGLVTEQITGPQGFTGEANSNGPLRLWLYKKERSIKVGEYKKTASQPFQTVEWVNPGMNPIKIAPPKFSTGKQDFTQGLLPFADNEHILHYQYVINESMSTNHKVFHNTDGEMLFQPSIGNLQIITECGILEIGPGIIGVIPKNMKFQVNCDEESLGVITELKNDRSFRIPHKGPIGANGLANSEYFQSPTPFVDHKSLAKKHSIMAKKQNEFFEAEMVTSPFDVYAWKGNYTPYRFNLDDFVPVVPGSKDHLDPSIHIVLSVGASEGANFVEFVCFSPRFNCTTDKNPTYLPPYDHRNNGKCEIMHYLGGYDARKGSLPGYQTVHDMGVAHGNDQATFDNSRQSENKTVFLDFKPATMIELTGSVRVASRVLEQQDSEYGTSLRGTGSSSSRPPQASIGASRQIVFTSFDQTLTPLFNVLMPDHTEQYNQKTGHVEKLYINGGNNSFILKSNYDQNRFWEIYNDSCQQKQLDLSRNPEQATDEELKQASHTLRSFMNRGTVIEELRLEAEDPKKTASYYKSLGFYEGHNDYSIKLEPDSPFSFTFIKKNSLDSIKPNAKSIVSTIDHTVFNIYKKQLPLMFNLAPDVFWGGDPRDLRAPGVQFYTRVLTNDIKTVPQIIPVNNLDETEEEILHRIQDDDSYLPPYIRDIAIKNQITRGLLDTNRTKPKQSKNGFVQHVAMAVNQKYGDICDHLTNLKKQGVNLIPAPNVLYYEQSEVDLCQRLILPSLFKLVGYDVFQMPYELFNGLLKPKDANLQRLDEILTDKGIEPSARQDILKSFQQIKPVLQFVGDKILSTKDTTSLKSDLKQVLQAQKLKSDDDIVQTLISLLDFNKKKFAKAQEVGSLIDFQIIFERQQSGYIDQTFSVPVSIKTEGTSGIFFEFIVRTCYDDVQALIKKNKLTEDETNFKTCGAFGQGNFSNLMLGQQKGIENADKAKQEQLAATGESFQMPMIDLSTINSNPLQHMQEAIDKQKAKGAKQDKIKQMEGLMNNIRKTVDECKKRNLWN